MNDDKSGWRPNILHDAPYKLHGVDPLWRPVAIVGWILVMILAAVAARGEEVQTRMNTDQHGLKSVISAHRCESVFDSLVTAQFLDAMEQVESGTDAHAVGDQGRSRGSYQFKAVAWAQVNSLRAAERLAAVPYLRGATNRVTARLFAGRYLRWLESHLAVALRRSPSSLELYAAWNLGPSGFRARGFLLRRCPAGVRDAGERLENLVVALNEPRRRGDAEEREEKCFLSASASRR